MSAYGRLWEQANRIRLSLSRFLSHELQTPQQAREHLKQWPKSTKPSDMLSCDIISSYAHATETQATAH